MRLKGWRLAAIVLIGLIAVFGLLSGFVVKTSVYTGPPSDHFDGERFFNQTGKSHGEFRDLIKWLVDRDQGAWYDVDAAPGPKPPSSVDDARMRVTLVGHATLLVQIDGLNILTDPIWSERCSPVPFAGPKRVRPPGIRFEDLPPIHAVVVSHNHYDHLDLPTLQQVHAAHNPRFFVGLGNGALLKQVGIPGAIELDWWQSHPLRDDATVTFVPAEHFSQRGPNDGNKTLWGGYVIKAPSGSIYFAGDTGYGPHFQQIRDRLGSPRLALLPIGAYQPRWFMKAAHINPEEAVRAHQVLGAHRSVAMHYGTFPLADDGQDEPLADLEAALARAALPDDSFWVLGFGEGREVPRMPATTDAPVAADADAPPSGVAE